MDVTIAAVLWVGTGLLLLAWYTRRSLAHFEARRVARGKAPRPSVSEIFGGLAKESLSDMTHRSDDPTIERKRGRAWIAVVVWFAYMIFGFRFWLAVVGLFSR